VLGKCTLKRLSSVKSQHSNLKDHTMKEAPFNITTVLFAVLGVSIIAGGLWAVILSALGVSGFWGIFLAAFLPVPLASLIRQGTASAAAAFEGLERQTS